MNNLTVSYEINRFYGIKKIDVSVGSVCLSWGETATKNNFFKERASVLALINNSRKKPSVTANIQTMSITLTHDAFHPDMTIEELDKQLTESGIAVVGLKKIEPELIN